MEIRNRRRRLEPGRVDGTGSAQPSQQDEGAEAGWVDWFRLAPAPTIGSSARKRGRWPFNNVPLGDSPLDQRRRGWMAEGSIGRSCSLGNWLEAGPRPTDRQPELEARQGPPEHQKRHRGPITRRRDYSRPPGPPLVTRACRCRSLVR